MSEPRNNPQPDNPQPPSPEDTAAKAAAHTRRAFLFKLSVALNAAVGAVLAVPLVGYLFGPTFKRNSDPGDWITLGAVSDFPIGETRLANFVSPVATFDDGDTAKTACWVRRISDQQFQVFAINCAHLGCPVRWFAESQLFMCPCHGGVYYADGSRASGPPERGLFTYELKIENNKLLIKAGQLPTLSNQAGNRPCPSAIQPAQLALVSQVVTRIAKCTPADRPGSSASTIG